MYLEENFIQLSALQHFLFCPRQCALIHIEQLWSENLFTAEGRIMHEAAHEEQAQTRKGVRVERGIALCSLELGLSGKADVVEFHKDNFGKWIPFPIEYKHGKPKLNNCDKVQLCAQALCLEEMMRVTIPYGAIFYGKTRHRLDVTFDEQLRKETEDMARRLHDFIRAGITPKPQYSKKCQSCSLLDICVPRASGGKSAVRDYLKEMLEALKNEEIS